MTDNQKVMKRVLDTHGSEGYDVANQEAREYFRGKANPLRQFVNFINNGGYLIFPLHRLHDVLSDATLWGIVTSGSRYKTLLATDHDLIVAVKVCIGQDGDRAVFWYEEYHFSLTTTEKQGQVIRYQKEIKVSYDDASAHIRPDF